MTNKTLFLISLGVAIIAASFFFTTKGTLDPTSTDAHKKETSAAAVFETRDGLPQPDPSASIPPPVTHHPKLLLAREILKSKNDNDLRMDTELKVLNEETKRLFREEYFSLPKEKLNERGTLIFLLGRNLTHSADFEFMGQVINEPVCLNLQDCTSRPDHAANPEHAHLEAGMEVTLAYPQIVALQSVENKMKSLAATSSFYGVSREIIERAQKSPNPKIQKLAEEVRF